jgi:hypothetical protein
MYKRLLPRLKQHENAVIRRLGIKLQYRLEEKEERRAHAQLMRWLMRDMTDRRTNR